MELDQGSAIVFSLSYLLVVLVFAIGFIIEQIKNKE